jgi:transcriptional regulator with XRE-family HTH domain
MATVERALDRGNRRGHRSVRIVGEEFRDQRLGLGISQQRVADAARIQRSRYGRIECGRVEALTIVEASRVASVLGLDLVVRLYPGGTPLRDAAHVDRLRRILKHVRAPLKYRIDVPLPQRPDQPMEQRGWDAMLYGHGRRTGIELEMRLRDAQATIRRHALKRRDDPVEGFLLVLADTRTNRRIYAENADLWHDLPRLRTSRVLAAVEAGEHPPSGIVFI